jgi:N-methylhydantoinase A/oxoprolinase/acetone carboxylase beta subunit
MTKVILGIDTGGTYTEGVLMDYHSREILKKTKTLTTKNDLTICILKALDYLLPDNPAEVKLVSLSTTLATNAIAEEKRKPVALFLLGYDKELLKNFHFDMQLGTPFYYFIEGGHDLEGKPKSPLDENYLLAASKGLRSKIDAIAVSGYFSPLNTEHEEAAAALVGEELRLPYVMGSQLSSKLNSIKRATTATLNASLLSTLNDFISSIEESLQLRGIHSPLMIMHSDGSLMNAERVKTFPIETVHSGPAASAVGARFLTGVEKALIIDIGGTTTDIAIIDNGRVNISDEGTRVGDYNTAVRAADVCSFGLGCDSEIWLDTEDQIQIGPKRVMPISFLVHQFPTIQTHLSQISKSLGKDRISTNHLEFWFLLREPKRFINNEHCQKAIDLLRSSPLPRSTLLERLELFHPMQFDGQQMVMEEIMGRSSLTPTDLFHLTGEYSPWNVTAAELGVSLFSRLTGLSMETFIRSVRQIMAERIVEEAVKHITGQALERHPSYVPMQDLGTWLFEENIGQNDPYLGSQIKLKMPIIGLGAPAGLVLPKVAKLLHADLLLPDHYEVANAVGAVVGSLIVTKEAWIYPKLRNMYPAGYVVQMEDARKVLPTPDEAIAYAESALTEQAKAAVRKAGGLASEVEITKLLEGADSYRIRVTAIGNPSI